MTDEPLKKAENVLRTLEAQGHPLHAESFRNVLLGGLREALGTLLTAVEAVDPKTEMAIEELRLSLEKHLKK